MDKHHDRDFDRVFDFARSSLYIQPLSDPTAVALDDDGLTVDPDEPPDHRITSSLRTYLPSVATTPLARTAPAATYSKKSATPMARQSSLLTEGLLTAASLKEVPLTSSSSMTRVGSQASAYSLTSNHGLTSDGGMSSPAHTGTPSPPLPPAVQTELSAAVPKARTIKFAGDRSTDAPVAEVKLTSETETKPRKTCISFACADARPRADHNKPSSTALAADVVPQPQSDIAPPRKSCISFACADPKPKPEAARDDVKVDEKPKRVCTIRFAADPKSVRTKPLVSVPSSPPPPARDDDLQSTPRPTTILMTTERQSQGSQRTTTGSTTVGSVVKSISGQAVSPTEARKLEKKKLKQLTGVRPEDEAWMDEYDVPRKPITVSDTLRKENAIRKLAEEASRELDEEYDIDDIVDEDDEDDDLPATGSRYMAYDEDESDGGHETDDEEGFAESDDDSDDDPDFQFWTTAQSAIAPATENPELLRPHHHRTASESSVDSQFKDANSSAAPRAFLSINAARRRKTSRSPRMRPGTPELPDSTDFVCGTLDEDRPLEEAYLSCIRQKKLEKRGIIPQDLDPSFPTSDPENAVDDEDEDEMTEGIPSTASDHHFLGGRFDESDASQHPQRRSDQSAINSQRPSPRRLRSPPPKLRAKSPAPKVMQTRAKSPAPRRLFGRSPLRTRSPAPAATVKSPPASPKGIAFRAPHLGQRNMPIRTASLPHTPNPFFVAHIKKMRGQPKRGSANLETHSRGPIDIKQGLEARKQRRKEQHWRKHCRDHKDKSRRCAPGKGAERMRDLGLEMAHRNRAYGQKLQLMLSV